MFFKPNGEYLQLINLRAWGWAKALWFAGVVSLLCSVLIGVLLTAPVHVLQREAQTLLLIGIYFCVLGVGASLYSLLKRPPS